MTEEERLRRVARESAEHAVHDTLEALGIDAENPREAQADFQTLRTLRRARERGAAAALWALVTVLMGGAASLLWDAITRGGK